MRKQANKRQSDILSVLQGREKPMTAYEILGELQIREPELAPLTIYRALAALTQQGRAHRLESKKAFVPCRCEHTHGLPVLAICDDCGHVEEFDGKALDSGLQALTAESGFIAKRQIIELYGQCQDCRPH